ncbi:hypothetical protein OG535_29290 [Kitasatospora sp. NBC_00085]|uniref:hypothetical protein n=1 Tax=Kitasatospora sp. NBC_00085 TaxID=2903566 RepID=UPI003244E062
MNTKLNLFQRIFWIAWVLLSWGAFVLLMTHRSTSALRWATGFFASAVIAYYAVYWAWGKIDDADKRGGGATKGNYGPETMAAGARFLITVEGVLIGLIFTSLKTVTPSIVLKVGLSSLSLGMVLGVMLFIVSSDGINGPRSEITAKLLFNSALLALTYGLICVTADTLSRR